MELTKSRLNHSISVARKMKELAQEIEPNNNEYVEEMFTLGLIHDIGYEFSEIQTEHADKGAEILKRNYYKYWQEVKYHGKINIEYKSQELNMLNKADLQTDPNGNSVTVEERLEDVKVRYGEESIQYKEFVILANEIGVGN